MEQNEESDKKLISSIINEEILNKLEKSVETMEPVASALASEDYKINILVTTICHGEKIILRPLVSFDDFVDNYMR
jgi:ribosomal protein S25